MIRVYFAGFRGFPDVAGGIETHVENLVARLPGEEFDIVCFGRSEFYRKHNAGHKFTWIWLWAPNIQGLEAFFHTLFVFVRLMFSRRGVVHLHGIGPGVVTPLLRLVGYRVVVTHHGYDYARTKWGPFAKLMLRFGEIAAAIFSNEIISVSREVAADLERRFKRSVHYLPNGLPNADNSIGTEANQIKPSHPFFLLASRLVPEKCVHDAIAAFNALEGYDTQLIIAGSADMSLKDYEGFLRDQASKNPNIQFIGFLRHELLLQYMRECLAFINASSHEGLPISVLEAGSQGAKLILSDIRGHREFGICANAYFRVGHPGELTMLMEKVLRADEATNRWRLSDEKKAEYSWDRIVARVGKIYRQLWC